MLRSYSSASIKPTRVPVPVCRYWGVSHIAAQWDLLDLNTKFVINEVLGVDHMCVRQTMRWLRIFIICITSPDSHKGDLLQLGVPTQVLPKKRGHDTGYESEQPPC